MSYLYTYCLVQTQARITGHPHADTSDVTQKNGILSYSNDHSNKNLSVSQKIGVDYFFHLLYFTFSKYRKTEYRKKRLIFTDNTSEINIANTLV